ncbi:MAG: hypothetical protein CVV18_01350 [Gammaproteobacteria bacterium HGW-Gammaproteobacteria-8]|nr:MAG: hypothetical protein CVV18_01350 [Gammaproteobacteria bacterium HGW-Gammaproteobacteria-8]
MPYPSLRRYDVLPAVAVLQRLLQARIDPDIGCDGNYGPATTGAVKSFQTQQRLGVDGRVGRQTWPALVAGLPGLEVVDCIDVFDENLYTDEGHLEELDIRRAGGIPYLIGGTSNGLEQLVFDVVRSTRPGSVFLLRFHGHGSPGVAGVSFGTGSEGFHGNSVTSRGGAALRAILARLAPIFGAYGCIEFMHCKAGQGREGREMLQLVADATGVPASAALRTQYGGGLTTFRFEGPTRTVCPRNLSLGNWAGSLPALAG